MRLRERLVLTLFLITLILVAPALVGLYALNQLREVARDLQARDAVGALALGRLQTALERVETLEVTYLALANVSEGSDRQNARAQIADEQARAEEQLERLTEGGYAAAARSAGQAWEQLTGAIQEEHRLLEAGDVAAADRNRTEVVNPAFRQMDLALDQIGSAINQAGRQEVERARDIAQRAETATLFALAAALAIALTIGGWLTRSVLLPIHELRRAMAQVAGGDLEPDLAIAPERPDEIGDLATSFRRMTVQLAELDRLKAEFVSVASHELKTPLSVIRGYVSLLRDGIYGDVPEEQRKILSSIGDQSDRLGRLIQQLLDVSRFEAGGGRLEIKALDLPAFLRELAVSFEALAVQNDIDFRLELDDGLQGTIKGDADRLNEVVGNLLSNAFKFTARHGEIRLSARSVPDGVEIVVTDTGVGIPAEQLPRVFEKFYQVENEAQPRSVGSGLGLAISREIVEAHGGTITAESEVGRGTTFRVLLPLEPVASEAA